ncbi:Glycerol-3-phosphate acyltransferase 1 [Linum perenne]
MVLFHIVLYRLVYHLLSNSFYTAAKKFKTFSKSNPSSSHKHHVAALPSFPNLASYERGRTGINTLVCDIQGALLRTDSFFPYFMLVAFEGGSIVRAFLLLISYPVIWFLENDLQLKIMIFITFCGLKVKDVESVSRAVLPKFYLENLHFQAYKLLSSSGLSTTVVTSVPRVMVELFVKEYLGVENVVGTELSQVSRGGGNYFTGFVSGNGVVVKHRAVKDLLPDVGIGCSSSDHLFLSFCKEGYVVSKADSNSKMQREDYPKPLIFHDGRLAFLPTPSATLAMFLWLPIGILLAVFRLLAGILLPYNIALLHARLSGVRIDFHDSRAESGKKQNNENGGVLYVCTHRTLLDPVFLSTCLRKPLTAVTYSLSKMSELIAPIRTVRLTRDRTRDGETMERMLREGDLVVCPEGTTCREPYLLRFSSLFAELSDEIVPVAVDTSVGMFYGTTASGLKWLDPIFFLMNPRPVYWIRVLEKLPAEKTCGGGGKSSWDVANYIQKQLAGALGFECTSLTRKDKYLMLAGNEGIVHDSQSRKQ